jgi:glucose-1-phosphate adenylyltransferase
LRTKLSIPAGEDQLLASMGIYVFNKEVLRQALDNTMTDFGKHIIPESIAGRRVFAYVFQGYWEDVGTIRSFFDANLAMCTDKPSFNLFDRSPVYTHARFLPPARLVNSHVNQSLLADGSIITHSRLDHCIVGVRTFIDADCELRNTIIMGCDFLGSRTVASDDTDPMGIPHMRIGRRCKISRAIIDKNVRIGDDVVIEDKTGQPDVDAPTHYVRDGIVIIPKNTDIPAGTRI